MRKIVFFLFVLCLVFPIVYTPMQSHAQPRAIFIGVKDVQNVSNKLNMANGVQSIQQMPESRRLFKDPIFLGGSEGSNSPTARRVRSTIKMIAVSSPDEIPEALFVYYGGHASIHGLSFNDTDIHNPASFIRLGEEFLDNWLVRGGPNQGPVAKNIFVVIEACSIKSEFLGNQGEMSAQVSIKAPPGMSSLVVMRTGEGLVQPRFLEWFKEILGDMQHYTGKLIFDRFQMRYDVPDSCLITDLGQEFTFLDKTPRLQIKRSEDFPTNVIFHWSIEGTDKTGSLPQERVVELQMKLVDKKRNLIIAPVDWVQNMPHPEEPVTEHYKSKTFPFHITTGRFSVDVNFEEEPPPEPPRNFSGRVVYQNNRPIGICQVELSTQDGKQIDIVKTDQEGRFDWQGPAAGDPRPTNVWKNGLKKKFVDTPYREGQEWVITVRENGEPPPKISGRVVYQDNRPIGTCQVEISTKDGHRIAIVETDQDGRFAWQGPAKGDPRPTNVLKNGLKKKFVDTPYREGQEWVITVRRNGDGTLCNGLAIQFHGESPKHDNRSYFVMQCKDRRILGFEKQQIEFRRIWEKSYKEMGDEGILPRGIRFNSLSKYLYLLDARGDRIQIKDKRDGAMRVTLRWDKKLKGSIDRGKFAFLEKRDYQLVEPDITLAFPYRKTQKVQFVKIRRQSGYRECRTIDLTNRIRVITGPVVMSEQGVALMGVRQYNGHPGICLVDTQNSFKVRVLNLPGISNQDEIRERPLIVNNRIFVQSSQGKVWESGPDGHGSRFSLVKNLSNLVPGSLFEVRDFSGNVYWGGLLEVNGGYKWFIRTINGREAFSTPGQDTDVPPSEPGAKVQTGIVAMENGLWGIFSQGRTASFYYKDTQIEGSAWREQTPSIQGNTDFTELRIFPFKERYGGFLVLTTIERSLKALVLINRGAQGDLISEVASCRK